MTNRILQTVETTKRRRRLNSTCRQEDRPYFIFFLVKKCVGKISACFVILLFIGISMQSFIIPFAFLTLLSLSKTFAEKFDYELVTCGTVLKLQNHFHNVRLHSHDIKYGSGSGQQSVTAVESSDDHNSYWQVRPKPGTTCFRGTPVKCDQTIQLMHLATRKNLHGHHFRSPLSNNLEVSAFGENGVGDAGDDWTVICSTGNWSRTESIRLKNVVTGNFLHVNGEVYGRPIQGQREVSGHPTPNEKNYWKAAEGIYVKPAPKPNSDASERSPHDEF